MSPDQTNVQRTASVQSIPRSGSESPVPWYMVCGLFRLTHIIAHVSDRTIITGMLNYITVLLFF